MAGVGTITSEYDALVIERVLERVAEEETIPHCHPLGQFVLVKQGILHGHTEEQHWLMKPGMAVWIPPHTVHWGQSYNRVDLTVFYISSDLCPLFSSHLKLINASLLIVALCKRLSNSSQQLSASRHKAMLRMLIEEINEAPESDLSLPLPRDIRLKKVTDSLISNPVQRRSLSDWGRVVGATERTLARLFRKETGMRYTDWHNRLLLSIAWKGLATGLSNEKISEYLGFSSGDSFGHWFRRVTGSCPGKVRRNLQNYSHEDSIH